MLNKSIHEEKLYVLSRPSNNIYVYNLQENKFSTITLDITKSATIFEEIKKSFPGVDDDIRTKFIGLDVNEFGIFVSVFHVGLIIQQYDFEGNLMESFKFENSNLDPNLQFVPNDVYVRAFKTQKIDDNKLRVYNVVSSNFSRVVVYDIQINN